MCLSAFNPLRIVELNTEDPRTRTRKADGTSDAVIITGNKMSSDAMQDS
jgi:hypothetical protein